MGEAHSNEMSETLAFHYLIVALGLSIFSYFVYGYVQQFGELFPMLKSVILRIPPSFANPLTYGRATIVVPLYTSLSLRVGKRFMIKHGFKLVFMLAFVIYFMLVWGESLSDDPFTIVGVSVSADAKAIRKACRRGSLELHPDKNPGREDEIRPKFEKHTRACKVLNDDKLRTQYVKWGKLPKSDKDTGGDGMPTSGGMLSVGGGSWILNFCFFFLLFVGAPSYAAFYLVDMLYDDEAQLAKIASDCKQLSDDMTNLYTYGHFSGMFLDIAELYILVAQAEFGDAKNTCTSLNPRGAKSLDSLLNHHVERFDVWKDGATIDAKHKEDHAAKGKKLDARIAEASAAIGNVAKRGKGSAKAK